jgi:hypothetical protein
LYQSFLFYAEDYAFNFIHCATVSIVPAVENKIYFVAHPKIDNKIPKKAVRSIVYSVLRPIYGASHSKVGFIFMRSRRFLAFTSIWVLAGKMPFVPFKPKQICTYNYILSHFPKN